MQNNILKKGSPMADEVVKTNRLNMAIQNLSLAEIRLMQLAIIDARETQTGISADTPLIISALRYAKAFDVDRSTAYQVLKSAENTLFERRFSFLDERNLKIKSRWVSQAVYIPDHGIIEIMLTPAVVNEVTRIDGKPNPFTRFLLEHTAMLNSVYSVRLYELLIQHRTNPKTPTFDLETFRGQLGLGVNEYKRMSDFKRRVLDSAVKEINEKTDLKISYIQKKNKSTITGFEFKIKSKAKAKAFSNKAPNADNADVYTIENLSDAQLSRITRSPQFIKDFSDLISPTSAINKDMEAWSIEFVKRIKKDHEKFNKKRPIKNYLKY